MPVIRQPTAAYVVKFKKANIARPNEEPNYQKLFINVCHSPDVFCEPDKELLTEDEIVDTQTYEMPFVLSTSIDSVLDNRQEKSLKIEAVVNTDFYNARLTVDFPLHRAYLNCLIADMLLNMHSICVEPYHDTILTKKTHFGPLTDVQVASYGRSLIQEQHKFVDQAGGDQAARLFAGVQVTEDGTVERFVHSEQSECSDASISSSSVPSSEDVTAVRASMPQPSSTTTIQAKDATANDGAAVSSLANAAATTVEKKAEVEKEKAGTSAEPTVVSTAPLAESALKDDLPYSHAHDGRVRLRVINNGTLFEARMKVDGQPKLSVSLGRDRIVVTADGNRSLYDFHTSLPLDVAEARSKFYANKGILEIRAPFHLPGMSMDPLP